MNVESTARELEVQPKTDQTLSTTAGISKKKSFLIGLQHVLAMDIFIPPMILAGLLSLSVGETTLLIQMTFLACGIATVIQAGFAMKLPVMQGPSFVPLSALATIGTTSGLPVMVGSLMPGALFIALLGYPLKLFSKLVRTFIPKIVAGTVIIVVGIALMPNAIQSIYTAPGGFGPNVLIASVTGSVLILSMYFGEKFKHLTFIKLASVIVALTLGTLVASFYGMVDFSQVQEAGWFALPHVFAFGAPVFELEAVLLMVFIYFIIMIETTGTWFTVSEVTDEKLSDNRLNGGSFGEGFGCFVGSLFGGTPVTGYSSNAGVLAITGVKSRYPVIAGGIILILLGMMPKLMSVLASIPASGISSVFAVICLIVMMNGFRVVKDVTFTERNMLIIGLPITLTFFTTFLPGEVFETMPTILTYVLSSGVAVGALAAVILNKLLPE